MTETLSVSDGRHVLHMDRHFSHPVDQVWRAITNPAELRHWFPSEVEAELHPGGSIRFFDDPNGPATTGTVLEYDPPRTFAFSWGDSVLRFQLEEEKGATGCRMLFSHTFDDVVSAASFAAGWTLCFANLQRSLAGEPADRGLGPWADLHDQFVARFGLDAGTVEEHPGGRRLVRFERQLTKPADAVWSALADGPSPVVGGPVPAGFADGLDHGATVADAEAPHLLRYRTGGGEVQWELSPGNGGALLRLTHLLSDDAATDSEHLLAAWHDRLEGLAKSLR